MLDATCIEGLKWSKLTTEPECFKIDVLEKEVENVASAWGYWKPQQITLRLQSNAILSSTCWHTDNLNNVPLPTHFCSPEFRYVCFSLHPFFLWEGQNYRVTWWALFYRSVCDSILHILITSWSFTWTVSNGTACSGHRTRSRSCKYMAHVCTNLPIDASLAPMSGRIEPSAVLSGRTLSQFPKSPWNWAETTLRADLLYSVATGFFFHLLLNKRLILTLLPLKTFILFWCLVKISNSPCNCHTLFKQV